MVNPGDLTLIQAKAFLARHGVDWSMDHLKQQIRYGKIKCLQGSGPPKIPQNVLLGIVKVRKAQQRQF